MRGIGMTDRQVEESAQLLRERLVVGRVGWKFGFHAERRSGERYETEASR
jgi:hypothetical protein